jgi:arsenate reductase-like glutaredoxin family protein
MTDVVIHHNPDCGTSRNVLALIGNAGLEPTIIECLKAPALGSKCTNYPVGSDGTSW